jgi:hypothetical protein
MARKPQKKKHCFVYVMERTTNKSFRALVQRKKEVKIGISNAPKLRRTVIDEDVKGEVVIREVFRFPTRFTAGKVENYLHDLFKKHNFPIEAGPRAGKTEWFLLSAWQYRKLLNSLDRFYHAGGLQSPISLPEIDLDALIDAVLTRLPRWVYFLITIFVTYYLITNV